MKSNKPTIEPQEVIDFFSGYFKISPEHVVVEKSVTAWVISHEPHSSGYTSGGYNILSKHRKFFETSNKDGEPVILEAKKKDRSEFNSIERFDKVIMKLPHAGKIPSVWSSVEEIENLLLRMKETTFVRIWKEFWHNGKPSGKAQIIGVYSLPNFIERSGSRFQDYASDLNPKMSFVFTFEQKDPGGEWRTICDPRSIISK